MVKTLGSYFLEFFLIFGISTITAGLAHGFYNYTGENFLLISWTVGVLSVFLITNATITVIRNKNLRIFLTYFTILQLIVSVILIFATQHFLIVTFSTVLGVALIKLPLRLFFSYKLKDKYSKTIAYAVAVSALSAIIHSFKISISDWFNHKDISHVILTVAIIIYYIGAKKELILNNAEQKSF